MRRVCPGLLSYVTCTLRACVEVTVVTVSPWTVWRQGPLIIRDKETDGQPANLTDRQTDRKTDSTAASADRPGTGSGPDKYKERRKSGTYGQEK